jgi:cobalt-zinc-cadmium efflux system outer membrane protein
MKACLFVASLLGFLSGAAGALENRNAVTIKEMVDLAVTRSPELRALNLESESSNQLAIQAGRWKNPSLEIGGEKKEEPNGDTNFSIIGLSQEIERPGRIRARKDVSQARAAIANLDRDSQSVGFRGRILKLIYDFKVADEKAAHARERLERFKTVNTFLRSRTFASPQKRTESIIVRSKLMVLNREVRELETGRTIAWNRLNIHLGLKSEPEIRAAWYERPKTYTVSELKSKAEAEGPELKRQSARVKAQEQELRLARLDSWPGLTLAARYSNGTGANPEKNYGLGLSIPLPLFDGNGGNIGSAQALASAESARLTWAKETVDQELQSAIEHYKASAESIEELSVKRIPEIEKDMKTVDAGFKRGQVDLITYLEADTQHSETLNAVFDSQSDFVGALTELLFIVGEAPQPLEN